MIEIKATFTFTHDGIVGQVFDDFIAWSGMGFQIEAASPELRKSIEQGRNTPLDCAISPIQAIADKSAIHLPDRTTAA